MSLHPPLDRDSADPMDRFDPWAECAPVRTVALDPACLSVSDLCRRGWTPALVRRFLGPPDMTARNPHCAHAAPMRLYDPMRVEMSESSRDFEQAKMVASTRRVSARRAAARRREEAVAWAESIPVWVRPTPLAHVVRDAVTHYNAVVSAQGELFRVDADQGDPALLAQIIVTHLRHCLAHYDELLSDLYGCPGRDVAYATLKRRVLEAIAEAYPPLAGECAAQAAQIALHSACDDEMRWRSSDLNAPPSESLFAA